MNPNHPNALNSEGWREKLKNIAQNLKQETRLTVMGSGATMLSGQDFRTSIDLDIWSPTSTFQKNDLKHAVEACGLLFNPQEEDPSTPYIQIVEPGICQLGTFQPKTLQKEENLSVEIPPSENLIASKLKRANPKDLEDIAWILCQESALDPAKPDRKKIRKIVQSFPTEARDSTLENLIYLDILSQPTNPNHKPLKKKTQNTLKTKNSLEAP